MKSDESHDKPIFSSPDWTIHQIYEAGTLHMYYEGRRCGKLVYKSLNRHQVCRNVILEAPHLGQEIADAIGIDLTVKGVQYLHKTTKGEYAWGDM